MKLIQIFLACSVAVGVCLCAPLEQRVEDDPELTAGYFEGDMVLPDTRNGVTNTTLRWPDNTVLYYINREHFDSAHIQHILRGMQILEEISCIRFKAVTPDQPHYVNITGYDGGCYSSVGYRHNVQTYNLQIYPLDSGCFRIGTIMHEFLHTLGFYHMQSASNRDDYVRIVEENISEQNLHNFDKYNSSVVDDYDVEYDYGSILHYTAYAFSTNKEMTIVPLKADAADIMGQRRALAKSDVDKLNLMYRCPEEV